MIAAVQKDATRWAARTSFSNRLRRSESCDHWSLRTLTAYSSPSGASAR